MFCVLLICRKPNPIQTDTNIQFTMLNGNDSIALPELCIKKCIPMTKKKIEKVQMR